ncbi:pseudouridine synthase [Cylindrospermum sp. NIES-4074]|nr:pseudouridine synthase [Cylindrospermum sp. NIES-4074]
MVVLHPLSDFINSDSIIPSSPPSYYYEGYSQTGEMLRLPRTALVEAIAYNLMEYLAENPLYSREGKMYGVLLVELSTGEQRVIKAFSGLLNGCSVVAGWVPPIPGRDEVALEETRTLAELETIKQELITLKALPARQEYATLASEFEQQLQIISDRQRQDKQQRQEKRQYLCETLTGESLTIALEQLDAESRQQGIERRNLKRRQNEVLQPLQQIITAADERIRELRQQRKTLSRQLQTQMQAAYSLTNFSGQSLSLQQLMPDGSPTGTGDCCAPKLLHYAAINGCKPLAMAEFWWGASSVNQEKVPGVFYGACAERCQPLMGFLLSGLRPNPAREVEIIYEDEWLIAVNKPPGLLSVPGRYHHNQDSVLSRLLHLLPDGMGITSVHRLDQETSGILLLARDRFQRGVAHRQIHHQLSWQFQQRQIHKVYEAILAGVVTTDQGVIDLPLWGDPENRPVQQVDETRGKPSLTHFRVMGREGDYTRVEFIPLTGRTHQLRVHAADQRGLGVTILGDRLYGCSAVANRLYLHARELSFVHPQLGETLHLQVKTPF